MFPAAPRGRVARAGPFVAIVLLLLARPSPALAAKTDVVVLRNGDRVTGEVKALDRARLELSTDSMGTIYIEIEEIASITAQAYFEVEDTAGRRHYGSLSPAGPGRLGVTLGGQTITLDLVVVVRIWPIGQRFISRFDGSVDLGASYTHSSGIGQGTFAAEVVFRRPSFEASTRLDTTITVETDAPATSRNQLQFTYIQLLRNRWMVPGLGQFESNSDLGLKLRSTIGGGVGRIVTQTVRQRLVLAGGVGVNREIPLEGDATTNIEAFLAATHSYFSYNTPKTDLSTRLFVYPSLSDPGRWRLTLDTRVKRELIKDFNVGFSVYDSCDNRPPDPTAAKNDVGVSVTVGWSF